MVNFPLGLDIHVLISLPWQANPDLSTVMPANSALTTNDAVTAVAVPAVAPTMASLAAGAPPTSPYTNAPLGNRAVETLVAPTPTNAPKIPASLGERQNAMTVIHVLGGSGAVLTRVAGRGIMVIHVIGARSRRS